MTRVVGVDGWTRGWVAVTLDRGSVTVTEHPTFAEVLAAAGTASVVGVDIPIGLPMMPGRAADTAARAALAPYASRVFPTFPRAVLDAPTYAEAVARCGDGPRLSRQAYGLRAKILEVDPHRGDARIFEVHPELAFAAMAGAPLVSKKTWNGAMWRRALLTAHGIELPDVLASAGHVPVDDVLDAAAVAWSSARIAAGIALCLPPDPPRQDGRAVAIWL